MSPPGHGPSAFTLALGERASPEAVTEIIRVFRAKTRGHEAMCSFHSDSRAFHVVCSNSTCRQCLSDLSILIKWHAAAELGHVAKPAEECLIPIDQPDAPETVADEYDAFRVNPYDLLWDDNDQPEDEPADATLVAEDGPLSLTWAPSAASTDVTSLFKQGGRDVVDELATLTGCNLQLSVERRLVRIQADGMDRVEHAMTLLDSLERHWPLRTRQLVYFLLEIGNAADAQLRFVSISSPRNKALKLLIIDAKFKSSNDVYSLRLIKQAKIDVSSSEGGSMAASRSSLTTKRDFSDVWKMFCFPQRGGEGQHPSKWTQPSAASIRKEITPPETGHCSDSAPTDPSAGRKTQGPVNGLPKDVVAITSNGVKGRVISGRNGIEGQNATGDHQTPRAAPAATPVVQDVEKALREVLQADEPPKTEGRRKKPGKVRRAVVLGAGKKAKSGLLEPPALGSASPEDANQMKAAAARVKNVKTEKENRPVRGSAWSNSSVTSGPSSAALELASLPDKDDQGWYTTEELDEIDARRLANLQRLDKAGKVGRAKEEAEKQAKEQADGHAQKPIEKPTVKPTEKPAEEQAPSKTPARETESETAVLLVTSARQDAEADGGQRSSPEASAAGDRSASVDGVNDSTTSKSNEADELPDMTDFSELMDGSRSEKAEPMSLLDMSGNEFMAMDLAKLPSLTPELRTQDYSSGAHAELLEPEGATINALREPTVPSSETAVHLIAAAESATDDRAAKPSDDLAELIEYAPLATETLKTAVQPETSPTVNEAAEEEQMEGPAKEGGKRATEDGKGAHEDDQGPATIEGDHSVKGTVLGSDHRTATEPKPPASHGPKVVKPLSSVEVKAHNNILDILGLARSHRGTIRISMAVGKALAKGVPRPATKPFPSQELNEVFKGPKRALPCFTQMLSVFSEDMDLVLDMRTEDGQPLLEPAPHHTEVMYEFECQDSAGREIAWDASFSIDGTTTLLQTPPGVQDLVDNLYIAPGQRTACLATRVATTDLTICAVLCRRRTQHLFKSGYTFAPASQAADPLGPCSFALQITEVQDLILQHHPSIKGALRAFATSPASMAADPEGSRVWYEVELLPLGMEDVFQENKELKVAHEAKWTPEEMVTEPMIRTLFDVTKQVLKGMDVVGLRLPVPVPAAATAVVSSVASVVVATTGPAPAGMAPPQPRGPWASRVDRQGSMVSRPASALGGTRSSTPISKAHAQLTAEAGRRPSSGKGRESPAPATVTAPAAAPPAPAATTGPGSLIPGLPVVEPVRPPDVLHTAKDRLTAEKSAFTDVITWDVVDGDYW
ncbi:MAG: hypothetical protein M1826_003557 [Phylliscum demangeonii]|nr:MAG: hypothetical protein M1826_003557 [Phylliscum demangeonii]